MTEQADNYIKLITEYRDNIQNLESITFGSRQHKSVNIRKSLAGYFNQTLIQNQCCWSFKCVLITKFQNPSTIWTFSNDMQRGSRAEKSPHHTTTKNLIPDLKQHVILFSRASDDFHLEYRPIIGMWQRTRQMVRQAVQSCSDQYSSRPNLDPFSFTVGRKCVVYYDKIIPKLSDIMEACMSL